MPVLMQTVCALVPGADVREIVLSAVIVISLVAVTTAQPPAAAIVLVTV